MTTATTCLVIRPLERLLKERQMHSLSLLVENNGVLQHHYIEKTFVLLHDIDHLLAQVGYSTSEEQQTTNFMNQQLTAEQWTQLREELDPDDLSGQFDMDILADMPELYRRAYAQYNIESWLELFKSNNTYQQTEVKTITLKGKLLLVS